MAFFSATRRRVRCVQVFMVILAVAPFLCAVTAYMAGLDQHAFLSSLAVFRSTPAPTVVVQSEAGPIKIRPTSPPQHPTASANQHPTAGNLKVPDTVPAKVSPITVSLLSPRKDSIKVGDMIHYRITCRHQNGSLLSSGGGVWYAFLSSKSNPKASTAGRVVDHKNGSYSIYAYAGWAGTGTLTVTRALDNDAVDYMNNTIWPAEGRGVWKGIFQAPKGNTASSTCRLTRTGNLTGMCLYPRPNALGKTVFYCEKPEGVECDKLVSTKSDDRQMRRTLVILNREKAALVARTKTHLKVPIVLENPVVNISGPPSASTPVIQGCHTEQQISDGYWLENKWYSLICENKDWTEKSTLTSCLRNKQLLMYGDSTSRQWFHHTIDLLGEKFAPVPGEFGFHCFRHYDDIDLSILISFPKQLVGSRAVRLEGVFYEHDLIDALNDTRCNYILVVSPWAHFSFWSRDSYTERTLLLREALLRFRRRCPDAPIVVKGPHPRERVRSTVFSVDFMTRGIGEINRRVLGDIGAWYLPTWDINNAAPIGNGIHMPSFVVHEELKVFFSYVCGNSKMPPLDNRSPKNRK
ncbi:NXPE family member 4-like [Patiria miniata]|uniref:NXPE C-terminal domain-containing protein n=1 Tax=Patiria miniata TaxID=46514 RepID=A0A913ZHA5_PATMI|nr:NXPE family member 4-like [Patiria miniata]